MKAVSAVLALSFLSQVFAAPMPDCAQVTHAAHQHGARLHRHRQRDVVTVMETITVDGDGNLISAPTPPPQAAPVVAPAPAMVAPPKEDKTSSQAAKITEAPAPAPVQQNVVAPAAKIVAKSSSSKKEAAPSPVAKSNPPVGAGIQSGSATLANYVNPSVKFIDGTIKCSEFPSSEQGVVAVPWMKLGGWTGIQYGNAALGSCQEGSLCSYACQPGMSKTQWPEDQPADGQSRGGLLCKGGYLYLTQQSRPYLCEWGRDSGYIKSSLKQGVAVCRTDYPGSENMNVPTWVGAGATQPLSVIYEDTYYKWQGKKTSTQYYVNNQGVSQQDGCVWGSEGSGIGNFSPMNLGSGYTDGITWMSMFPNPQNGGQKLNFNIIIEPEAGSTMNGACSYINGVYTGGAGSAGCTVACKGTCYFKFF